MDGLLCHNERFELAGQGWVLPLQDQKLTNERAEHLQAQVNETKIKTRSC